MKPTINDNNQKRELKVHSDSAFQRVTLCIAPPEWSHEGSWIFWTFVDGKLAAQMNRDHFRNRETADEDDLVIRKGAKGDVIVSAIDLKVKMTELMSDFSGEELSKLQNIYAKNVKMIEYAQMRGNRLRARDDKEKEQKHKTLVFLAHKDIIAIQTEIKKAFESKRLEYITANTNGKISRLEYASKEGAASGKKHLDNYLINYNSRHYRSQMAYYEYIKKYFEVNDRGFTTFDLKKDFKKMARTEAEKEIQELVDLYVANITQKIGGVVVKKNNLKSAVNVFTGYGAKGFEGDFVIKFNDKSQFTIHSMAVFAEGEIQCAHYRFPITFHDITNVDGSFKKKMSEEEMLQQFK